MGLAGSAARVAAGLHLIGSIQLCGYTQQSIGLSGYRANGLGLGLGLGVRYSPLVR